jgi:hypothetical protein
VVLRGTPPLKIARDQFFEWYFDPPSGPGTCLE